jgi:uncharacterized membrane protein YcaP (DUF421 family)
MNNFLHLDLNWLELVIRGTVVYIFVLLLLRLTGKRQLGQMGATEFVAILLISNAVQNAMNGGDNSVTGGLLLATVIIVLSYTIDYLTFKSPRWEALIQGRPTLLIHHGEVLQRNLDKEHLNLSEVKTILRRQGIHDLGCIQEAVLESNGSVSVVHKSEVGEKKGDS